MAEKLICGMTSTEYQRQWRMQNREKVLAIKKANYQKHRDSILVSQADRRKREREYIREIERASHARRKEVQRPAKNARQSIRNRLLAADTYVILDKELRKIYSSPCVACGSAENQSLDHVIPLSRDGEHRIGNVRTMCLSCNISKGTRYYSEWKYMHKRGRG